MPQNLIQEKGRQPYLGAKVHQYFQILLLRTLPTAVTKVKLWDEKILPHIPMVSTNTCKYVQNTLPKCY